MRAAVCTRYGGPEVVEVRDVPAPAPTADEVLVRVRATTVASGDHRVRAFDMPKGFGLPGRLAIGFRAPRQPVLGTDVCGEVVAVGRSVTSFRTGDIIVAAASATHAELACVDARKAIVHKPTALACDEAVSLVFGGLTAVLYLRDLADVRSGQHVLVYGASGAVGTASVQLAHHLGAHVTAVCGTRNVALASALGADDVLDYTAGPPLAGSRTYDAIFDTVGKTTYKQCKGALAPGGVYLPAVATPGELVRSALLRRGRVRAGIAVGDKPALELLMRLAAEGAMRPVIDRRYALEDIAEAHRYVDTGHKTGSVVITVEGGPADCAPPPSPYGG